MTQNRQADGTSFFDQPVHGWPRRRVIASCDASKGPLLTRYYLFDTRWFALYLHHLHTSDEDRALHDHPWSFIAVLLSSGYWEWVPVAGEQRTTVFWRRRFSVLYRPATWAHRLQLIKPTWTLVPDELIAKWRERADAEQRATAQCADHVMLKLGDAHRWMAEAFTACAADLAALAAPPQTPQVDLSNHHNALTCPYCNPDGLKLVAAGPPPSQPKVEPIKENAVIPLTNDESLKCQGCGGLCWFETSVPSVVWNEVIRVKNLPEYLCAACIVRAFVKAGRSFTATLWGDEFNGVPIEVQIASQPARDVLAVQEENNTLRCQLRAAGPPPSQQCERELIGDLPRNATSPSGETLPERLTLLMWALVDLLKANNLPFETWPDDVKGKFADVIISPDQSFSDAEFQHAQELAAKYGWQKK